MKSNELRIGNLVFIDGKETIVNGWMIHLIQIGKHNNRIIEPIPLTEEWLIKFGFNKDYKDGYIGKDFLNQDFVLTEPFKMGEWQEEYAFQFSCGGLSKFKEIKSVHQLQNLYFALTGEELEIIDPENAIIIAKFKSEDDKIK